MTCVNQSPVCERVNWDCAPDYPVTLLDVYCTFDFLFSTPLYTPTVSVLIYLFVVNHCMCFVLRPNFPHETLTCPGPACSKDRQTDNVPALGTATCIAAQKGRRPEGSASTYYVNTAPSTLLPKPTTSQQHHPLYCPNPLHQNSTILSNAKTH